MAMFGRAMSALRHARPAPVAQPFSPEEEMTEEERQALMFPMEDVQLPEAKFDTSHLKRGMFGAGKQERGFSDWMDAIGSGLINIGQGAGGENPTAMNDFLKREQAKQDQADYFANLDDMDLTPDQRMFAESNPDEFVKNRFADEQARKESDDLLAKLDPLNLSPRLLAIARANPQEFSKTIASEMGKVQTGPYKDPLSEEWNMRPPTFAEETDAGRVSLGNRELDETIRANDHKFPIDDRDSRTRERNATTNQMNARKYKNPADPGPDPTSWGGQSDDGGYTEIGYDGPPVIDDEGYMQPPSGGRSASGGQRTYGGARVIKVGVGPNGEWTREDDDGEMTNGIPAPMYNDMDKVTPGGRSKIIEKENSIIQQITKDADALRKQANLANQFLTITQEGDEPYVTGDDFYLATTDPLKWGKQKWDPRGDQLDKITKELTIDMGQGMKGAFSDGDRIFLQKGVSNRTTREQSNVDFAKRQMALANRMSQYDSWMRNYRAVFKQGSVMEAQRYWDDYKNANPVFDSKGQPQEDIPTITEWFGGKQSSGAEGPFNRKVNDPNRKKDVSEMSDDELKKQLGLP